MIPKTTIYAAAAVATLALAVGYSETSLAQAPAGQGPGIERHPRTALSQARERRLVHVGAELREDEREAESAG